MRLALFLALLLQSFHITAFAATDETSFPFPPDAQACIDHMPSPSNDPDGFIRCVDITEVAALERWKALYVAKHPATKVCRDNPPPPSDPSLTSRCSILIDQEDTTVAHYKDKLRVNMGLLRTKVSEYAAKKAARKAERRNISPNIDVEEEIEAEIERLDAEIAKVERGMDRMYSSPMPMMREPIYCTSYSLGMFVNTDCY
jgi:hypothetical protein